MTLDGTNTWVLRAPGSSRSIVVDPGPDSQAHLAAVAAAAGDVATVLLTHHHLDHSAGARRFAEMAGCGVRALDPAYRLGDEGLHDGDVVAVGDLELAVVGTPGHTADSLSFVVRADDARRSVLTGDTILGRGTTVVAHPDGKLGAYLALPRPPARARRGPRDRRRSGPGTARCSPTRSAVLDHYIAHRHQRLDQVREALAHPRPGSTAPADLPDDLPRQIVEIVYADVDPILWGAAELSVRAQLDYLLQTR